MRNGLPEKFSLEKGAEQLEILLEALFRDERSAQLLIYKIRSIPTVNRVTSVLLPVGVIESDEAPTTPAFWI